MKSTNGDGHGPADAPEWKARFEALERDHARTEQRLVKTLRIADKYQADLRAMSERLAQLTAKVRALQQAVLPVCMHCKRIRSEGERWSSLDGFLFDRADIVFSHGVCPDCLETRYAALLRPTPPPPSLESTVALESDLTTNRFDRFLGGEPVTGEVWRARLEELLSRYRRLLRRFNKVTLMSDGYQRETRETSLRLEHAARSDSLTGLLTRGAMVELLTVEASRVEALEATVTVVLIRARGLGRINARHGIAVGDALLRRVAKRVSAGCSERHACARWGATEFLVLAPPASRAEVEAWVSSLRASLADASFDLGERRAHVSVHIGISDLAPALSLDQVLAQAYRSLEGA